MRITATPQSPNPTFMFERYESEETVFDLQANRIVPGEENSLSSYYRKDSIEIGRDKGVLDIKLKERGRRKAAGIPCIINT
jgi:hypothetical protein